MRLSTMTILYALAASCDMSQTWSGIPDARVCGAFEGRVAVCVAEQHQYTCVASDDDGCNNVRGTIQCLPSSPLDAKFVRDRARAQQKRDADAVMLNQ